MATLESSKIKTYYEIDGKLDSGDTVVLIHGMGTSHRMWYAQYDVFCKFHKVLRYDVRGHGETLASDHKMYDYGLLAKDLEELLDELEISRAVLVGVSMGGLIAQQFAVDFPARVSKLVLCDTFSETPWWFWPVGVISIYMLRLMPNALLARLAVNEYPKTQKQLREYMREEFALLRREETIKVRRTANRFKTTPKLHLITAPALILVGEGFSSLVKLARKMHKTIPDSKLVIVPDSKDPTNLMQPRLFNWLVLNFLKGEHWNE